MNEEYGSEVHGNKPNLKSELDEKQLSMSYNLDLLAILKDAVIITDENFIINYWNPAAEEIYGWKSEEVLKKKVKDILRTKFIGTERSETIKELLKNGSYEDDVLQFTKKGFPLFISSKVVNITDGKGNIHGYISINRDLTSQKNTEKKLKRNYNILNSIIENTTDAIYLKNLSGNYIMANSTVSEIVGKCMSEIIGRSDWELYPTQEAATLTKEDNQIIREAKTFTYEETLYSHREGEVRNYITTKGPYRGYNDNILGIFGIVRDITHLKVAEHKLKKSEEKYRTLFETMSQGVVFHDLSGKITSMNPAAERILGYNIEEIHGRTSEDPMWQSIHEDGTEFPGDIHPSMIALKTGREVENVVMGIKSPRGDDYRWLNIHAVPQFRNGEDNPYQVYTTFTDITQHKNAKSALRKSEEQYRSLFNKITEGFALHEIILNKEGKPIDYRFIDINPAFEELTGLKREDVMGKLKSEVIPEDNVDWVKIYGKVALTGESTHFNEYSEALNRHYDVLSFSPAENQFAVIFSDITMRKKVEDDLNNTMKALQLSNAELEQFAYIASHDLKEPLRMITSFLQLLQRRYKDKLDEDANDFIDYAVDGASRLHELIDDLLTYSRVNQRSEAFIDVDMGEVLKQVEMNLDILINENNAVITNDHLPVIKADKTQMIQLFQNLIYNSLEYRSEEDPVINVNAKKEGNKWLFSVEDNGIGIEPKYSERIFKIFQRLHTNENYDGTGIGLAISKRILEKHGGNIWIDKERGKGTKFNFTIRSD
jgi:PAS domain S-box-containing protein